jgi:hypothetical protein
MSVLAGLKLIASLLVIAAVCGFFYGATHQEVPPSNQYRYGCVIGRVPPGHTLLFVDRTDPFTEPQVRAFRNEITRVEAAVKPGEMLTVVSIGAELPPAINFRACCPERGDALGFFDGLRQNRDWLQTRSEYEQSFQRPIETLADGMALNLTSSSSPIIQSMADAMEQLGPSWSRAPKRRAILITDLMENTPAFSQYDRRDNGRRFAEVRQCVPYIRESPLDLRDTAVTVLCLTGLPYDSGLQGIEHQRFWRDLIQFYGGEVVDWVVVPSTDQQPHP